MYGLKPVPFRPKSVPFMLKPVPFKLSHYPLYAHGLDGPWRAECGDSTGRD
jgi:hypothetical protein